MISTETEAVSRNKRRSSYYATLSVITSPAGAVTKYCDENVCACVCLSLREDISGITRAILTSFWATVCKTVRPMLSDRCLSVCLSCPVCDVHALWPNGSTDQDETWHACRPRPWPQCVRWGPSSLSPNGAHPPIFGPYLLLPNGGIDQDATGIELGLSPGDFVLDGDPAAPKFSGTCLL